MHTIKIAAIFASTAALALAGCGDNDADEAEVAVVETDSAMTTGMDDNAYPVASTLNETQQASYDAMDREAVSVEYDTNRDALMQGAADTGTENSPEDDGESQSTETMPSRSQMDFAWLDRNSDGKLSVAEYAIWAVPANPTTPAANDEKKPYLTQDQINEAGQSFFYFDNDGSTYLSPDEFAAARNSTVASA